MSRQYHQVGNPGTTQHQRLRIFPTTDRIREHIDSLIPPLGRTHHIKRLMNKDHLRPISSISPTGVPDHEPVFLFVRRDLCPFLRPLNLLAFYTGMLFLRIFRNQMVSLHPPQGCRCQDTRPLFPIHLFQDIFHPHRQVFLRCLTPRQHQLPHHPCPQASLTSGNLVRHTLLVL